MINSGVVSGAMGKVGKRPRDPWFYMSGITHSYITVSEKEMLPPCVGRRKKINGCGDYESDGAKNGGSTLVVISTVESVRNRLFWKSDGLIGSDLDWPAM